jgi:hypothetical protein|tara:strand:+ start:112 stop:987 length:876 start_codon:yes stop_codon:yes gene_type:complete
MKRVVFSVYIDLSEYDDEPYAKDHFSKIKKYHNIIWRNQEDYAWKCDANYVIINRDAPWYDELYQKLKNINPEITHYQAINNFKILCLDKLKYDYDEILYLDSDVIVNTDENIFEEFDLSKGICLAPQKFYTPKEWKDTQYTFKAAMKLYLDPDSKYILPWMPSSRSPVTKYVIAKELLNKDMDPEIWNTGIIAINRDHVNKLDYFGDYFWPMCKDLVWKRTMGKYGKNDIKQNFSINNESIITYLTYSKNINVHIMDDNWHHIYDQQRTGDLNSEARMIHVINKRFEDVL